MTPRRRRLYAVLAIVLGISAAVALGLYAAQNNLRYFYDPSEIAAGEAPNNRAIRIGGMVTEGSLRRTEGTLAIQFVVTDFRHSIPVRYTGLLPDLFKEGQGVVAHGRLEPSGVFVADDIVAKHDENYMPPEVARSLKQPPPAEPAG